MKKILIIDDNSYQLLLVSKTVEGAGFEPKTCKNGNEGLLLVKSFKPDLVICDLSMPEMSGEEFIMKLRDEGNKVPIIILTSDIQNSTRVKFEKYAIFEFLQKPLERAKFLEVLEKVFPKK